MILVILVAFSCERNMGKMALSLEIHLNLILEKYLKKFDQKN